MSDEIPCLSEILVHHANQKIRNIRNLIGEEIEEIIDSEEWKEHKKRLRRQERIDAQNRRIERFKRKYGHSPFIETEKQ